MSKISLIKKPINEEIENKKSRINLLESDRKAYSENVKDALQDCKKRVLELRKETNKLRQELYDKLNSDEHIITQAFQRNPLDKSVFAKKTCNVAIEIMNYKVSDKAKQLNFLKDLTASKRKFLDKLIGQHQNISVEVAYAKETMSGINQDGQEERNLENRLDKAILKCSEAEQLNKVYIQIKDKLKEEYLHYGNHLDDFENEISFCNKDLCHIRVLHRDAIMARDLGLQELKHKEDQVFVERKRREKELIHMKRASQDKEVTVEKGEKRLGGQDSTINDDDIQKCFGLIEMHQQKIVHYEELYNIFQHVSGVLNLEDAVLCHKNQNNTERMLKKIIDGLERQCVKLRKEKEKFINRLFLNKYENESKSFGNEETHRNTENYFEIMELNNIVLKDKLNKSRAILALCKLSSEHLNEILPDSSFQQPMINRRKKSTTGLINDLLDRALSKTLEVMDQTSKFDIRLKLFHPPILENYNEFQLRVLKNVPPNNMRITIKKALKDYNDDDDQESGEDDNSIPNRISLKKQAFLFVEAKLKKKAPKKKKKAKEK